MFDSIDNNLPKPFQNSNFSILPQDAEVIFFFGDLNFRLKGDSKTYGSTLTSSPQPLPSRTEILRLINEGSINQLLEMDELLHLLSQKHGILSQFQEEKITFLPSYKFDLIPKLKRDLIRTPSRESTPLVRIPSSETTPLPRTHSSKSLNSNPPSTPSRIYSSKRLPAYCDRILYYADHRYTLTPLKYITRSFEFSDHDPVMGVYHLERVEGDAKVFIKRSGVLGIRVWRMVMCCWKVVVGVIVIFGLIYYSY